LVYLFVGFADFYVDFRSYQDLQEQTARLWTFIAQRPAKRLIIDMRWNGGGNFMHGRQYLVSKITFMPQINRAGRLFVIIGRRTFSAGMTNVTDFRRETEAVIVGEPTGGRPNGYQENHWFTLPLSKIRVSCATLKYRFQPYDDSSAVCP
jgi:C-terminal processing protease CtpA/Prc